MGAAHAPSRRSRPSSTPSRRTTSASGARDVDFVGDRILRNLLGVDAGAGACRRRARSSSRTTCRRPTPRTCTAPPCAAFVTDVGGKTSHSAILARAFEIPAVVGARGRHRARRQRRPAHRRRAARRGDHPPDAGADARSIAGARARHATFVARAAHEPRSAGRDHRRRARAALRQRRAHRGGAERARARRRGHRALPHRVPVSSTAPICRARRSTSCTRAACCARLHPYPGDLPHLRSRRRQGGAVRRRSADEANPALGLRSIRLCLRERTLFKSQLRGLLRASVHGRMRIMFPMISGVGELREAKAVLEEAKAELDARGRALRRQAAGRHHGRDAVGGDGRRPAGQGVPTSCRSAPTTSSSTRWPSIA